GAAVRGSVVQSLGDVVLCQAEEHAGPGALVPLVGGHGRGCVLDDVQVAPLVRGVQALGFVEFGGVSDLGTALNCDKLRIDAVLTALGHLGGVAVVRRLSLVQLFGVPCGVDFAVTTGTHQGPWEGPGRPSTGGAPTGACPRPRPGAMSTNAGVNTW